MAGVSRTTAAHGFVLRSPGSSANSMFGLHAFFFPPIGTFRSTPTINFHLASLQLHGDSDDEDDGGDVKGARIVSAHDRGREGTSG